SPPAPGGNPINARLARPSREWKTCDDSPVRHAILGAGGVGGLLAGALARRGASVLLLMRPATLEQYGGRLVVESRALGDFEMDVPAAPRLDREVDVLWVTTKATQLEAALELAPAESV